MITMTSKEIPFNLDITTGHDKFICAGAPLETIPLIQRISKAFINEGFSVGVVSTYQITLDSQMFICSWDATFATKVDVCIYYFPEIEMYHLPNVSINDFQLALTVEKELKGFIGTQVIYNAQMAQGLTKAQICLLQTDPIMIRDLERAVFGEKPTALSSYREELRKEANNEYEQYQINNVRSE